jgi:hypothetical protein
MGQPNMASANDVTTKLSSRKSMLLKNLVNVNGFKAIQIIDDNNLAGEHFTAVIHLLLGRRGIVSHQKSVVNGVRQMVRRLPQLVVLKDHIPPVDYADRSVATLRKYGYGGPIIITGDNFSRERRRSLLAIEPIEIIAYDDVDSWSVAECLIRVNVPAAQNFMSSATAA